MVVVPNGEKRTGCRLPVWMKDLCDVITDRNSRCESLVTLPSPRVAAQSQNTSCDIDNIFPQHSTLSSDGQKQLRSIGELHVFSQVLFHKLNTAVGALGILRVP